MINPNVSKEPTLIFSIFEDYGPEIVFNNSGLSDDAALTLVMSGMTLVEMNKSSVGRVDGSKAPKMLGPIPVPGHETLKAIALPFETKVEETTDERIAKAGYRLCVAYFVFEGSAVREVLDSYGLIEPYFTMIARGLSSETKINSTTINQMYHKMIDMFSGKIPRIFAVDAEGNVKELVGKKLEYADTYFICDMHKKIMHVVIYNPTMDVWRKRDIYKIASELNSNMFRSALRINTVTDVEEMSRLLDHLNIEISPV